MRGSRKFFCPRVGQLYGFPLTLLYRILANVLYCAKINRDKASGKHDKYIGYGDDRDPEFRMVL